MPQRQARQYARRPQVWRQVRLAGATAVSSAAGSLAGGAAVSTAAISGSKLGGSKLGGRYHGSRCHSKSLGYSPTAAGATAVSTADISVSKLGSRCHGKSSGDSPTAAAQRQQVAQKNNKQRAKTNILRAFLFLGPTNLLHRRRILLPKVNFSFHESRSPCIRAQKPRFCARNAQKWGVQTPKAHKNPDFVLEMPENRGSRPQKRTKTPILCSKSPKMGVSDPKSAQKPRYCAREEGDWQWEEKILASESATVAFLQITAHAFKMQMLYNQIINF